MKYKYIFSIIFILMIQSLHAQNREEKPEIDGEFGCIIEEPDERYYINLAEIMRESTERGIETMKLVRVNIHFMLKTNGTGNFTETGDNNGTSRTGYNFANDLIVRCNSMLGWNPKMNLPPGNTTANPQKKFRYVLDEVYFHRDDNYYSFNADPYNTYGEKTDSVINIFFTDEPSASSPTGYAGTLNEFSKIKYTNIGSVYAKYLVSPDYSGTLFVTARTVIHEVGHTQGLNHTVRYGNACPCATIAIPVPSSAAKCLPKYQSMNYTCGDALNDTPTAWDLMDNLGSPIHPGCGWVVGASSWCSNNMMDYGLSHALTPNQLTVVHNYLEGGMRTYTVCDALMKDEFICEFDYPKENYFGKNIKIKPCSASTVGLSGTERASVYFAESVEFYPGMEISGSTLANPSKFEVIHGDICN